MSLLNLSLIGMSALALLLGRAIPPSPLEPSQTRGALKVAVDLVLLDLGLPGEDGFALLSRLRAHPTTAQAHVAAVTANILHETRLRAKDAGFDSFISKPIRPDKLCDQIGAMLAGRSFWW